MKEYKHSWQRGPDEYTPSLKAVSVRFVLPNIFYSNFVQYNVPVGRGNSGGGGEVDFDHEEPILYIFIFLWQL